jgi:AcrR family transcriptional regulator
VARAKTEPRKRPKQARSQALYDALIEATRRLLAAEGVAAVTTARVAELAGVSIGSLYQYFPSREALIAGVVDDSLNRDVVELMPLVAGLGRATLDEAIVGLVELVVRFYRDETDLYREMVAALPAVQREEHVERFARTLDQVMVAALTPHRAELLDDFPRCAWIMRETLLACVRAAAREHPESLADGFLAGRLEAMCRALVGAGPAKQQG